MPNKKINKLASEAEARRRAFEAKQSERELKAVQRKKDNRIALLIAAVAVLVALGASFGRQAFDLAATPASSPSPTSSQQATQTPSSKLPDKSVAENRTWTGQMLLNTTGFNFELDGKKAPQAVANFVTLAKNKFYRGVSCHRLTTEGIYVLQCGDPNGDGTGGPGYSFGPIENAPADAMYKAGYLAMARVGGNGESQGSQFFIVYQDSMIPSDAAGGYTVFGKITSGLDKLQRQIISQGTADGSGDGAPKTPVAISFISVK